MKIYHINENLPVHKLNHGDLVIMADNTTVKQVTKCLQAVFFGHCDDELAGEALKAWKMAKGCYRASFVGQAGFSQHQIAIDYIPSLGRTVEDFATIADEVSKFADNL